MSKSWGGDGWIDIALGEMPAPLPGENEEPKAPPLELYDQEEAERVVSPVPLFCGLCRHPFNRPPWDPKIGVRCENCGAVTRLSR